MDNRIMVKAISMGDYYRRTGFSVLGGNARTRGRTAPITPVKPVCVCGNHAEHEYPERTLDIRKIHIYRNDSLTMVCETETNEQYFFRYPPQPYNFMLDFETLEFIFNTKVEYLKDGSIKLSLWGVVNDRYKFIDFRPFSD